MKIYELFPYLCVNDAKRAITFYGTVFGAIEKFRLVEPSGRIGHAELAFGAMTLMLCDEFPEFDFRGPDKTGSSGVLIHLHVENCDEVIARAVAEGAKIVREPRDQFYGERSGTIIDPFGHRWNIGHAIEEVTPEEMQRRYTQALTPC